MGCQWASGQSVSLLPAIQATGLPIVTPAGLTPAGLTSLFWTHVGSRADAVLRWSPSPAPATSNRAGGSPAPGSPARFAPRVMRPTATAALSAATRVPAYSTWPARISLPLGVYPPSQVLQSAGAFLRAPLPPMLSKELRTAGSLRSTGITPPHHYCGPIRHPLIVGPLPGAAGYRAYPASVDFATGRGGLLQLLGVSWSPCCR
jgi:hypothetical protein